MIREIASGKTYADDYFKKTFESLLSQTASPRNLFRQFEMNRQAYENQLEKLKIDLAHIDDEQKNLEMMFLEYVEQINANIGMIDKNSTISVRGRSLKMLRIQVPDWETEKEHFRLKLHDYFENIVKLGIETIEKNENLTERIVEIEAADTQLVGQLKQRFSQRYPYQTDILRKNKYSVSELKHRAMREKFEAEQEETIPAFLEEPVTPTIPLFIQRQGIVGQEAQNKAQDAGQEAESKAEQKIESNTANRGALRGTAVHRVMECYDFASEKSAQEQMEAMEKEEKITADMRALVKEQTVADFVSSETGKRMALAQRGGALYREKPFVMGFTEEELERYGFGAGAQMIENEAQTENAQQEIMSENVSQENHMHEEDLTLIQGIIDVFWIEDDGITVLDYKTDRVDTAQELIDRYATQLKLYADALERVFATRKLKVKEILIYSFRLEKLISIE